jgi:hypothetical protein
MVVFPFEVMARPVKNRASTLEEAVMQLKRDPSQPVRVHVNDVDVELHLVGPEESSARLGDFMADGGGWKGESAEEILHILREARKSGGSAEPPKGL